MQINRQEYLDVYNEIKKENINTICMAADCPNRYECFSKKTMTFLVLGNICTRNCKYCDVLQGIPKNVENESKKIIEAIKKFSLEYVVITQVTRDDLKLGGSIEIKKIIEDIKENCKNVKIEVLISDLNGADEALDEIIKSKPDVINHNIEVVEKYFYKLRPKGNYHTSINLLKKIKEKDDEILVKSGLMVGFGENIEDIKKTLIDLKNANVDFVTIGQYFKPKNGKYDVIKIYTEEEYKEIQDIAKEIEIKKIIVGKYVRSSYKAKEVYDE